MKIFTGSTRPLVYGAITSALLIIVVSVSITAQTTNDNQTKRPAKAHVAQSWTVDSSVSAPGNDNFANAIGLGLSGSITGSNIEATGEVGEYNHAGSAAPINSVWYKFTAPSSGVFTIRGASSNPTPLNDTVLAAYTGSSIGNLTTVASSDDYLINDYHARLVFSVQANTTYFIAVDGYDDYQGTFALNYQFSNKAANDNFANAENVGTSRVGPRTGVLGSNAFATGEPGEPSHDGSLPENMNSIWYKWQPMGPSTVTFRTDGSNFDTVLAVYKGASVGNLTLVAKNDDFGPSGTRTSRVTFFAPPGTYYIAIDGYSNNVGNSILLWDIYREENGMRWDFDGDAVSDISIFRPSNGQWWINSSALGVYATTFGESSDVITPGDFTGDGRVDIALWRPSNGNWFVLRSENNTFYSAPFGQSGDIPTVGRFDRDAKADHAVFRPSTGKFYILNSFNGQTQVVPWGTAGDIPVIADYDGDGTSDVAIYRPSVGQWWLLRSKLGALGMSFGSATDKPVVGDYTGDGRADVAFWRPATGEWFILRSNDFSYYSGPFGQSTDVPVPGDYDGNGTTDVAVFRPSDGKWYIVTEIGGLRVETFGAAGDRPVPSAFVP